MKQDIAEIWQYCIHSLPVGNDTMTLHTQLSCYVVQCWWRLKGCFRLLFCFLACWLNSFSITELMVNTRRQFFMRAMLLLRHCCIDMNNWYSCGTMSTMSFVEFCGTFFSSCLVFTSTPFLAPFTAPFPFVCLSFFPHIYVLYSLLFSPPLSLSSKLCSLTIFFSFIFRPLSSSFLLSLWFVKNSRLEDAEGREREKSKKRTKIALSSLKGGERGEKWGWIFSSLRHNLKVSTRNREKGKKRLNFGRYLTCDIEVFSKDGCKWSLLTPEPLRK